MEDVHNTKIYLECVGKIAEIIGDAKLNLTDEQFEQLMFSTIKTIIDILRTNRRY